jgi:hypothetical protein
MRDGISGSLMSRLRIFLRMSAPAGGEGAITGQFNRPFREMVSDTSAPVYHRLAENLGNGRMGEVVVCKGGFKRLGHPPHGFRVHRGCMPPVRPRPCF